MVDGLGHLRQAVAERRPPTVCLYR